MQKTSGIEIGGNEIGGNEIGGAKMVAPKWSRRKDVISNVSTSLFSLNYYFDLFTFCDFCERNIEYW